MQKKEQSVYEQLRAYGKSDYAAFHMPGHKRQTQSSALPKGLPWEIDITEIDDFDDLHHAEGILKGSMERAAAFYGVKKTLYSINGSTAGILSAVFAAARPGDTVLMGRNCHKSVYHAVLLRELRPLYLYPQVEEETGLDCGYISAELEKMLTDHPQIRAVILTSPTYEGVISDIEALARIVRRKNIPLIVDEAHGAHLTVRGQRGTNAAGKGARAADLALGAQGTIDATEPDFPLSATALGADLVIQSLHKTLPSLTQTAVLHVCEGAREALAQEAARYMSIFQTSSPSYVLLASIDTCVRYMDSAEGRQRKREYALRLDVLRGRLRKFRKIRLLEPGIQGRPENGQRHVFTQKAGAADTSGTGCPEASSRDHVRQDASKLVIAAEGCTGKELYDWLRVKYHLQPEMCTCGYVLLMTSLFDTDEMYGRLCQALEEIDEELCGGVECGRLKSDSPESDDVECGRLKSDSLKSDDMECGGVKCGRLRSDSPESDDVECGRLKSDSLKSDDMECGGVKCGRLRSDSAESDEYQGEKGHSDVDGQNNCFQRDHRKQRWIRPIPANQLLSPSQADRQPRREVDLWESAGCVSAEYVYLYPPGIPLLVPGEEIREAELSYLKNAQESGLELRGLRDASKRRIQVAAGAGKQDGRHGI